MSKILVTGGAGFIGSNLVNLLVEQDNDVIIFDNGFRNGFRNLEQIKEKITIVEGNITLKEDWNRLPKDCDFVYHLAAINGTKYFYEIPETVLKVNVQGVLNFVEWLEHTSTKQIFFASSPEVYGFPQKFPTPETEYITVPDPNNARFSYSSSKIVGETIIINFARQLGIDFSIARIHNVYGPNDTFEHVIPEFIRKCVTKELFTVQGDGKDTRCFCYISDAIEAILLITQSSNVINEIYNIGSDEETSINQLIELLQSIHGKKLSPIYEDFKNPGTKRRVPDITKICKLGYKPKISLQIGLQKTYDWYSKFYNDEK